MEKPTNEEVMEEKPTQLDVSKLTDAQKQAGINHNMHSMVQQFVNELKVLEQVVDRPIDVLVNAKLADGRKIHIRVK